MADPLLHIKDSYFFEVPKFAWRRDYKSRAEFPDIWVKLDPDYQDWEAGRLYEQLEELVADYNQTAERGNAPRIELPPRSELISQWHHWVHQEPERGKASNFGKPFDAYLEENLQATRAAYDNWKASHQNAPDQSFEAYLQEHPSEHAWFARLLHRGEYAERWSQAQEFAEDVQAYKKDPHVREWSKEKIENYNHHLSGKVLIPQPPFVELRNLHESESRFSISKYMVIQVVVAILLFALFRWLAVRVKSGQPPRGRLWNMLEAFLVFVRDQIARPAIGHHDADRFVPLLWTIFMFILFCNLFGMIPMLGAPTAVWGVTAAMALITLGAVVVGGMRQFGPIGFFLNQVPHMDLPWYMSPIKVLVFLIEIVGLLIRHAVLSIRLLANMAAGHLVILGLMAVVFGARAAMDFSNAPTWQWGLGAFVVVVGSALFSVLELFVAFLQAYIFTFLSALFIGAAVHHH